MTRMVIEDRVLGRFAGETDGPCLVVVGGIHGNEPSGVEACRRVVERLRRDTPAIVGDVFFLAGNLGALREDRRFLEIDLNRAWKPERVEGLVRGEPGGYRAEDREQWELIAALRDAIAAARGPLFFLDLHTSSSAGPPFLTVGDTLRNREFARGFPLPLILGLEEMVEGALLELLNNHGFVTLGVEAGQHRAPEAPGIHEAAVWLALARAGILVGGEASLDPRWLERLSLAGRGLPEIVEVRHRHPITPEDDFRMEPGRRSFDPVRKGEIVAHDRTGEIPAPETGRMLLPLYQGQGDDGFFLARDVRPFWLNLSAVLRRSRTGWILRWLPGVRRDPERRDELRIDTRVARWFPLEIFHLFGFRKSRREGPVLVMSRRAFDLEAPSRIDFA